MAGAAKNLKKGGALFRPFFYNIKILYIQSEVKLEKISLHPDYPPFGAPDYTLFLENLLHPLQN